MAFFSRSDDNFSGTSWVAIVVLLLIFIAGIITVTSKEPKESSKPSDSEQTICATFVIKNTDGKDACMAVEAADTDDERIRGLSGREKLDPGSSMVFVFDNSATHCMWMKDMKFSLDMVWLDEDKKITEIKKNLKPESFPEEFCAHGKYVIEMNAGTADKAGLTAGQRLNI